MDGKLGNSEIRTLAELPVCIVGHHCAASTESEGAPKVLIIHIDQELIETCRPWMGESEGDKRQYWLV